MYQLSQTLAAAVAAGAPQRVLIEFVKKPDGTAYDPPVCLSNEEIVITTGVKLTSEFNSNTDLTVGQCPSAQIQFALINDRNQLADFAFGTFNAYLGARIDQGTPTGKSRTFIERGKTVTYEFAPLGKFVAMRPDIVRKKIIDVSANDQMTLFDVDMPDKTALNITYPVTLSALCQAMCAYAGVTLKSNTWMNSTLTVASEPEQFEGSTMRDVLSWIAEAACSNARFDRDGVLEFTWFSTTNKVYDEHDYSDFTQTWYETRAIDGLHIRNANSSAEYVVGTGDNAYMIQDNPFLRQSDEET